MAWAMGYDFQLDISIIANHGDVYFKDIYLRHQSEVFGHA